MLVFFFQTENKEESSKSHNESVSEHRPEAWNDFWVVLVSRKMQQLDQRHDECKRVNFTKELEWSCPWMLFLALRKYQDNNTAHKIYTHKQEHFLDDLLQPLNSSSTLNLICLWILAVFWQRQKIDLQHKMKERRLSVRNRAKALRVPLEWQTYNNQILQGFQEFRSPITSDNHNHKKAPPQLIS